jgi:hypothetical protein
LHYVTILFLIKIMCIESYQIIFWNNTIYSILFWPPFDTTYFDTSSKHDTSIFCNETYFVMQVFGIMTETIDCRIK